MTKVAILFHDAEIASLFAELSRAKGAITRIVESAKEIRLTEKIITEASFIDSIPEERYSETLLVSNGQQFSQFSNTLRRPLTEGKVIKALSQLID
jgi:hypothetical protein